jgi:hypothetical protein
MVDVLTPVAVLTAVTPTPGILAWLASETTPVIDPIAWPDALSEKTTSPNNRISSKDLMRMFVPPSMPLFLLIPEKKHSVHTHLDAIAWGKHGLGKRTSRSQ